MLNWGILGCSRIAAKVVAEVAKHPTISFYGIASNSPERARQYSEQLNIPNVFSSYEELINSDKVNSIYLTTKNEEHFKWAMEALKNGKHVLCEKPLAFEIEQMIALKEKALDSGLLLMEGFMYRHHLQIQTLKDMIERNTIGDIKSVYSSFHFTLENQEDRRLSEVGGGALLDVGCYCVDISNYLFARNPAKCFATSQLAAQSSADTAFNGFIDYGNGSVASFDCSFHGPRKAFLRIVGTKGVIQLENPFKGADVEYIGLLQGHEQTPIQVNDPVNSFTREFLNFQNAVAGKEQPLVTLDESLRNTMVLADLKKSSFHDFHLCPL